MTDRLFAALEAGANSRGISLANEDTLIRDLQSSPESLQQALSELEARSAIDILAPPPFLVVRLKKWSGKSLRHANPAVESAARRDHAYSFQSSLSQSQQLNESYRQPTGDENLLREILETLGESDPTTFRGALHSYSPVVIRAALARVRRTRMIRKNRTAVFRYLLPRIAKEHPPIR